MSVQGMTTEGQVAYWELVEMEELNTLNEMVAVTAHYPLTFTEAMRSLFNHEGVKVQGEKFGEGCFLTLNTVPSSPLACVVIKTAGSNGETPLALGYSVLTQKYRTVK
jgi:hypothetical protein